MCSLRACALAALLLMAAPVAAQQAAPDAADYDARIDSLIALMADARADLDSAEQAGRRQRIASGELALDTQRVGVVTVVSLRSAAREARTTTERALRRLGRLGVVEPSPLAGLTLLVETGRHVALFEEMKSDSALVVWVPPYTRTDRQTGAVLRALETWLTDALPADLRTWLGGSVAIGDDRDRWQRVYRASVLTPSTGVDRCNDGDLGACAAVLELAPAGPLWRSWYSREQLVAWAREQSPDWRWRPEGAQQAFDACFTRFDVASCGRESGVPQPPAPLPADARVALLARALDLGGDGAYATLVADSSGPVIERLARAAGTTPESLLADWRNEMIASRPAFSAGLGRSVPVMILWTIALCALAMRSKRWRLG